MRRRRLAGIAVCVLIAAVAWASLSGSPGRSHLTGANATSASPPAAEDSPEHFVIRRLPFPLPFALQDAAAVPLGRSRAVLLGGLNAADTSTATVSVLDAGGVRLGGLLPDAQHDAQGTLLAGRAYVFGGGQFNSYMHILSYDPNTGRVNHVASLPTPTSDAAVAAIAGTAYVVGGYDGEQALNTIVAWRPGSRAQVVAHLPYGLRYAAAAASGARLVIAGGSRGEAATGAILSFDPTTGAVRRLGEMPAPTTHAAAVALGRYVYILGGRGAAPGSQSAAIVAIDPGSGSALRVGALPLALSDASAVLVGGRIWLAGGLSAEGTVASVLELTPARGRP